jgi:hypothetical protein
LPYGPFDVSTSRRVYLFRVFCGLKRPSRDLSGGKNTMSLKLSSTVLCSVLAGSLAHAEGVTYSPYVGQDFPQQVFFGDTYIQTFHLMHMATAIPS